MNDNAIRDLTLSTWVAGVWDKELRGVPLQSHEAALAYCMRQHKEWREYWNQLTHRREEGKVLTILMHISNDAAVRLQLDRNDPPEIRSSYELLRSRGITDMDALHAIACVLQEQTWKTKNSGGTFDMKTYVERVKSSVQMLLENPKFIRSTKVRS